MFRMALGVGSVAILVLAATGCKMCCHPYDKSGPVFSDCGCQSSTCSRAGSIFAGDPGPTVTATKNSPHDGAVSPSPTPAQPQAKRQRPTISYVMASKRAASPSAAVAEAKKPQKPVSYAMAGKRPEGPQLGPAQPGDVPGSEKIVSVTERVVGPSGDSTQVAAEPSSESSKTLPTNGWAAHRPTTELVR
jgi:hypothetical protein